MMNSMTRNSNDDADSQRPDQLGDVAKLVVNNPRLSACLLSWGMISGETKGAKLHL